MSGQKDLSTRVLQGAKNIDGPAAHRQPGQAPRNGFNRVGQAPQQRILRLC
ncbi:MAG: hypothetical protein PVJ17_17475 [Lysobacterales bacterium]